MSTPRIARISITNIMGIAAQEFAPGAVTIIEGDNGMGKSSCLRAIESVFGGGHDPDLIRRGEGRGEVLITLADSKTIKKVITAKTSTLECRAEDGTKIPSPKEFVEQIAAGFAFDPLAFARADNKARLAFLLKVMPIIITSAELEACGIKWSGKDSLDLDGLDALDESLREKRKLANSRGRDAEGTVSMLAKSLPAGDDTNWGDTHKLLIQEQLVVEKQISDAIAENLRCATEAERVVLEEIAAKINVLVAEREERVNAVHQRAGKAKEDIMEVAKPERERLATAIGDSAARAEAQQRATGTRDTIDKMRQAIREAFIESDAYDKQVKAIEGLRRAKLDALPIAGVTMQKGVVFVEDSSGTSVPFDKLNTAEQFKRSFEIAGLQEGRFMIADRAECLSEAEWKLFLELVSEYATANDLQVLAARVTSGPLKVAAWEPQLK